MNTKRYVIAGAISVALHSVLLSAIPNQMVMAMPMGVDSTKVSLNLVSAPTPQSAPAVSEPPPIPQSAPQPVKEETEVKKLVKKTQPEQKPEPKKTTQPITKKMPPKPVEKVEKQIVKQPIVEKKSPASEKEPEKKQPKSEIASGVNNSPKLVSKPTFATRPSPVKYPRIAKRRGLEGQVLVEVWIDEKGKQVRHSLVHSSGTVVLDEAALKAIQRWRFSSHVVDGQAIAHRVQIPVRFKLD
ncbi:energy transducer TonB [Photobacterium makurazakiensis]|uniref:energy transducer TonB n=1 Tax=Photobacterium makurazakiensis TaxID=2910234 RepID=UPI003D0A5E54